MLWEEMAEYFGHARTWLSLKKRFLNHILPSLPDYKPKVSITELIEADENAKAASIEATGQAWSEKRRYSEAEDEALISHIATNQLQSQTGGEKIWQKMEEEEVVKGRGWESMKSRYMRITANEKEREEEEILATAADGSPSLKRKAYTEEDDLKMLRHLTRNQEFERVGADTLWQEMEAEEVLEGRSWVSMRNRFKRIMKNVEPASLVGKEEEEILAIAASGGASTRRWGYTDEEEEKILRYVVRNSEYHRVGAPTLWQKMVDEGVVEGRSWKSMQEHFLRTIMNNLEGYPFLLEEQRSLLKERAIVKDEEGKLPAGLSRAGQPYTKEEDEAILSFIADNQGFAKPGAKLWKKMEEEKVLEGRSLRSIQQRYQRIMKNKKLSTSEDKGGEMRGLEEMEVDKREMEDGEEKLDDVDEVE